MPITQFTKLPVCSHNLSTMYSIYFDFSSFSYSDFSQNEEATPPIHPQITSIPVEFPSNQTPTHVPVILPLSCISAAAVKIQSAYRRRLVRTQIDRIRSAAGEADRLERLIRRQDTVDAIRRDSRERLRISEELMAALLRLDGVPGFYAPVREIRRAVSRRIVGLQELLDAVADAPDVGEMEGIPASLEEIVWGIWEEEDGREEHWVLAERVRDEGKERLGRNFCWG